MVEEEAGEEVGEEDEAIGSSTEVDLRHCLNNETSPARCVEDMAGWYLDQIRSAALCG